MEPISAFLLTFLGAAAASASEQQVEAALWQRAFQEAWSDFLDSQRGIAQRSDMVRYDAMQEDSELPPLWDWSTEYNAELDREIPVAKPPYEAIYVVYGDDNSFHRAYEYSGEAIAAARFLSNQDEVERVEVGLLADVPYLLGRSLLAFGTEDQDHSDGYDAASAASYYLVDQEPVWSYNMYEDEPFEEWGVEAQERRRTDVLAVAPRYTIEAGTVLYTSDDDDVPFGELERIAVTDDRQAPVRHLVEFGWRKSPRFMVFGVTDDIENLLFAEDVNRLATIEEVLGQSMDDLEDFSIALEEHVPEAPGFIAYDAALGANRIVLTSRGMAALEKAEEFELSGRYDFRGRLQP